MKYIFLLGIVTLSGVLARAENLLCQVRVATKIVSEEILNIPSKGTVANFGNIQGYQFKIQNSGNSKYSLEIFDAEAPARFYAEAHLHSPVDELNWAVWNRQTLLEVYCHLNSTLRR